MARAPPSSASEPCRSGRTSSASPAHSKQRGEGTLTFVGEGPLRQALEGRRGIELAGRVGHDQVPTWIAACDVLCQPSLVEPFGLATLEAMASGRSVVATRIGGPPEFVSSGVGSARRSRERERARPRRSRRQRRCRAPTSRRATPPPTATSSCRRHGWRRFSSEPLEIGQPDLDQRTNGLLEPGRARDRERLLVGRADLLRARRLASGGCRP